MRVQDFILELGGKALADELKYIISGHNGPYYDPETPLRVRGHWIIIFSRCYDLSGDKRFRDKVRELADSLLQSEARPFGYSFHHRDKAGKDNCNGLIGQAWTFEALVEASNLLDDSSYTLSAREVYRQHTFNYDFGLWNRLEIDGRKLSIDDTFNHQLWFAACSSLLIQNKNDIESKDIYRFLDCLPENLTVLPSGLIYHPIERKLPNEIVPKKTILSRIKSILRPLYRGILSKPKLPAHVAREMMILKSIGYHSFNMYAFAILKMNIPDHPYWESKEMKRMVSYMRSDDYCTNLDGNKYSYSYNPPSFEVPFALSILDSEVSIDFVKWISTQIEYTYSSATGLFDKNNEDPVTLTARIYELTRLKNLDINVSIGEE